MTTPQEKENLRTIICRLRENDLVWMKAQDVRVGDKGACWILNYGLSDKNEFNRLTRGLVVRRANTDFCDDPLQLIMSFPFIRFFNRGEDQADEIAMDRAEMLEKLDGNMVGVYFPTARLGDPHWHTRNMVSSYEPDMRLEVGGFCGGTYKLMEIIGGYVRELVFSQEDLGCTYVFEFIHCSSAVLTRYREDQWGLYLLAARNLQTHREHSEDELDSVARRIGARRPRRWDAMTDSVAIAMILKKMAAEVENFEGVVFRERGTGKRVKLKDPHYVEKHHMIGELTYRRLVPRVFDGESEEVVTYFPHARQLVNEIKSRHEDCRSRIVSLIADFRPFAGDPRRELWERVSGRVDNAFVRAMIMRYASCEDPAPLVEMELRNIAYTESTKETPLGVRTVKGATAKYLDLLGLKDEVPRCVDEV